jgi:two-component system, NarL family, nitrate/nitrite response regulator NarL
VRAGLEVAATVATGAEALAFVERDRPEVILMDIGLPDRSGLAVGAEILASWPSAKLMVLTALESPEAVEMAMRTGFRGYLSKETPVSRFVSAVQAVADGHAVFPPRSSSTITRPSGSTEAIWLLISQLTAREKEVLGLLVEGADGRTIAARLGISRNTVRTHVQSILTKLQVHSRLEAATLAVRHRVVPVTSPSEPS